LQSLIDIGVNLTHESFDHDRSEVVQRAAAAGVTRLIITGSTAEASRQALDLAHADPGRLFTTVGVHPHHATQFNAESAAVLAELATDSAVVAIGECGLDYYRDLSPRAVQRRAFTRQLSLAAAVGKPVFLHQRDAHEDFLAIVREHIGELPGGVAHCFTGSREQMEPYLTLGLCVGITGWICDERRGAALRDAVAHLPLDRVLLETDAPYLLPRNLGQKVVGRRNEPAFLPVVLSATAASMGVPAAELAAAATRNTEMLFQLPPI
jgi:TatD DNase family protein